MLRKLLTMGVMGLVMAVAVAAQTDTSNLGEELKENRLQLREANEQFKTDRQALLERRKAELEKKRAEYKAKLEEIKERRKKLAVEQFVKDLAAIKAKRVAQFKVLLGNLNRSLAKLEAGVAQARSAGKDTGQVETDLAAAKAAVAQAQTAVEDLAAKDFTPTITSEETLKADLKAVRDAFNSEVRAVNSKIKTAREAANKVLLSLKQLRK